MEQLSTTTQNLPADGDETKIVTETIQYIVIRLGGEQYGIDINFIDNIVRMQHITRIPKVPAYLKGVINLRGEVIPVMSLRLRMGLEEDQIGRSTRIIILKLGEEGNVGVLVDEVREVVKLPVDKIEKTAHGKAGDKTMFVNAVGKNGDELISLLDLSTITLEENA